MLYASRKDGSVRAYDLQSDVDLRAWTADSVTAELTGLALAIGASRADLPLPRRFKRVVYSAEVLRDREGKAVAERVSAICDNVWLSLTMYLNGRIGRFRVDLDRRGTPRFRPSS